MQLDNGGYQIRSWRPEDEDTVVKYANNRRVWINMRDVFPHPYEKKDAREWIQSATHQIPETHFAIASAREAIGGIGLRLQEDVHRRSAEVGYWLGEPFWGRGIATTALSALTEFAFGHFDLVRIYATTFEWNPASARVLEKAGYQYEGRLRKNVTKDGNTIDQFLYGLVREH